MQRPPDQHLSPESAIVEAALDAIVSMDHRGLITEFNQAAERAFGYSRAQAIGRPLAELIIPPALRQRHREGLRRYLATGNGPAIGQRLEVSALRADGTEFPAEVSICRIPSSDPPTFTGFIRDLSESKRATEALRVAEELRRRYEVEAAARTERELGEARTREAEQLRQRLASMLEASPDLVGFADAGSRRILYLNKAGRRMLGVAEDEDLTGRLITEFHPEWAWQRLIDDAFPTIAAKDIWNGECAFRHRDGHEIPAEMLLMGHRGTDGGIEIFSTISHDITERKKAEQVMRSLTLEQAARTAAEEAVRVRDDFVATAGHELRTPLTSLLMRVDGLYRALHTGTPEDLVDRVGKLATSGHRLATLIDQLLDVSRITSGRLRLEPEDVDMLALVGEVVARFADESARAQCTVCVRCDAHVRGSWDRLRIDQVVTNLLSNAIKYGRGKPIELDVAAKDGSALVRVTDHGIGIDREHRERLFSRFERAISAREYGGFGLGLWISRQIVEASGGTIEVESTPGRGSAFTFLLPLPIEQRPDAP
jgi:PAS domain S-box-containing protein